MIRPWAVANRLSPTWSCQAPGYLACQHNCHELTFRFCPETNSQQQGNAVQKRCFCLVRAEAFYMRKIIWLGQKFDHIFGPKMLCHSLFWFAFCLVLFSSFFAALIYAAQLNANAVAGAY